jgi:cyclophilin family peptidyl-prolyl cis-trans isomerase
VLVPGKPDSAGSQFFIVLADQPSLDNQYTVFGRVGEGIEVLQKISEAPVDEKGVVSERIEIKHVAIRDTPAEPFVTESAQELGAYRAVLDTSAGPIAVEFFTDKAPGTVRQFMRLAASGVYNGMAFHRVAPGFVIQTGALSSRVAPLTEKQQKLVHNLAPEFNDTKHVKGIVSMARGDGARQRDDVVLHRHRRGDRAGRRLHRVRARRGRHGGGRCDRSDAEDGGVAEHAHRLEDGADRAQELDCQVWRGPLRAASRPVKGSRHIVGGSDPRSGRRHDPRDAHRDADQVLDLNAVARLHVVPHDGLRTDAGHVGLTVGVFEVGEEHVPRHLAVNARRLNFLQNAVASAF